jgi:predicted acyltransferase (DUF342 family)
MMITRKKKLISAVVLIALFVLARPAGATVITTYYTQYTIFAEGTVTIGTASGTGSTIWGMVGAIDDVTIEDNTTIVDRFGTTGNVYSGDDVTIWDGVNISGSVIAMDGDADGGGVTIATSSTVTGQLNVSGQLTIGANSAVGGSIYQSGAQQDVTIGASVTVGGDFHVIDTVGTPQGKPSWTAPATVTVTGTGIYEGSWNTGQLKASFGTGPSAGTATAPDTFTYTTRTAPSFNKSLTLGDQTIVVDGELAPGVYQDLVVNAGITLTVSEGTYDFRNITLASGANIAIKSGNDPANVIIQAFQDLFTSGSNVLGRVGQGQLTFNVGKLLTIGASSTVAAHLLAFSDLGFNSIVDVGDNSWILGKIYSAGDVIIRDNVLVPEPGTLVLLGLGAASLLARRRRRRNRA